MTMREKKKPGRPKAEDQKPMLPAKIIQAHVETGSLEKTASRCGIAPNTVKAVLTRNPEDFATAKKALGTRMLTVADDAVEIAGERLDECSAPQAAVVAGIFTQRGTELLEGQSTGVSISWAMVQRLEEGTRRVEAVNAFLRAVIAQKEGKPPEEFAKLEADYDRLTEAMTPEEREKLDVELRLMLAQAPANIIQTAGEPDENAPL